MSKTQAVKKTKLPKAADLRLEVKISLEKALRGWGWPMLRCYYRL